ncbi:MAG: glycoside hydrolase 100 family protein [Armatimonadota bacterium]
MTEAHDGLIEEAKKAALDILLRNSREGVCEGLPRTAGWGYPEPYTRDLMISALGVFASGNEELIAAWRRVFVALAKHQTAHGHIPSLAHDPGDLGASDTTPLFLMALAIYRRVTGEKHFLEDAEERALRWMDYQSPADEVIVGQLPTTDWRDEQYVVGFGLYVNTITYAYLRLLGHDTEAKRLQNLMKHFVITSGVRHRHVHEGLVVPRKPYYAMWAYKICSSERFDLLGNSLAVLNGIPSCARERSLIMWIEDECDALRECGDLVVDLPPNFFPYIRPTDPDWLPRYEQFNRPGEYHNGGIWPFICGFYVVATLAAGFPRLAERRLVALTELAQLSRDPSLKFGFNEWIRAQDGTAQGNDWQTWSAAMYLYAAICVEKGKALFFENFRNKPLPRG